jgi:hypothetical protein
MNMSMSMSILLESLVSPQAGTLSYLITGIASSTTSHI